MVAERLCRCCRRHRAHAAPLRKISLCPPSSRRPSLMPLHTSLDQVHRLHGGLAAAVRCSCRGLGGGQDVATRRRGTAGRQAAPALDSWPNPNPNPYPHHNRQVAKQLPLSILAPTLTLTRTRTITVRSPSSSRSRHARTPPSTRRTCCASTAGSASPVTLYPNPKHGWLAGIALRDDLIGMLS